MVLGWDPPKTGLWVLGYEAGIYKTGTRLKSLPDWYWFHQVGIASGPYQTGTGFMRLVLPQSPYQTGTGFMRLVLPQVPTKLVLVSGSLSLSLFPG
jgi:hypothetical protein